MIMKNAMILPDFEKGFPKISLASLGLFTTMINVPENDYLPVEALYKTIPASSKETIDTSVSELLDKFMIIKVKRADETLLAVNKRFITKMKLM